MSTQRPPGDAYLSEHLDVTFTHGMCPDCMHKLYPDTEDG
jgi:hypothetical protein